MAEPDVQKKFVDDPKAKALQVDRVKGGEFVVQPESDDPLVRFGDKVADVFGANDLTGVLRICQQSKTFRTLAQKLGTKKVTVDHAVRRLHRCVGGGTTEGGRGAPFTIVIWPDGVLPPYTVLDVYIHEYGHVHFGLDEVAIQKFVNQVQDELGVRRTPDSHKLKIPGCPEAPAPAPTKLPLP